MVYCEMSQYSIMFSESIWCQISCFRLIYKYGHTFVTDYGRNFKINTYDHINNVEPFIESTWHTIIAIHITGCRYKCLKSIRLPLYPTGLGHNLAIGDHMGIIYKPRFDTNNSWKLIPLKRRKDRYQTICYIIFTPKAVHISLYM